MWIKDIRGDLVNTDYLESISLHKGQTCGWYNDDYVILAAGDVREKIATALRSGDNFVEVE